MAFRKFADTEVTRQSCVFYGPIMQRGLEATQELQPGDIVEMTPPDDADLSEVHKLVIDFPPRPKHEQEPDNSTRVEQFLNDTSGAEAVDVSNPADGTSIYVKDRECGTVEADFEHMFSEGDTLHIEGKRATNVSTGVWFDALTTTEEYCDDVPVIVQVGKDTGWTCPKGMLGMITVNGRVFVDRQDYTKPIVNGQRYKFYEEEGKVPFWLSMREWNVGGAKVPNLLMLANDGAFMVHRFLSAESYEKRALKKCNAQLIPLYQPQGEFLICCGLALLITADIKEGEPILVSYGHNHWHHDSENFSGQEASNRMMSRLQYEMGIFGFPMEAFEIVVRLIEEHVSKGGKGFVVRSHKGRESISFPMLDGFKGYEQVRPKARSSNARDERTRCRQWAPKNMNDWLRTERRGGSYMELLKFLLENDPYYIHRSNALMLQYREQSGKRKVKEPPEPAQRKVRCAQSSRASSSSALPDWDLPVQQKRIPLKDADCSFCQRATERHTDPSTITASWLEPARELAKRMGKVDCEVAGTTVALLEGHVGAGEIVMMYGGECVSDASSESEHVHTFFQPYGIDGAKWQDYEKVLWGAGLAHSELDYNCKFELVSAVSGKRSLTHSDFVLVVKTTCALDAGSGPVKLKARYASKFGLAGLAMGSKIVPNNGHQSSELATYTIP